MGKAELENDPLLISRPPSRSENIQLKDLKQRSSFPIDMHIRWIAPASWMLFRTPDIDVSKVSSLEAVQEIIEENIVGFSTEDYVESFELTDYAQFTVDTFMIPGFGNPTDEIEKFSSVAGEHRGSRNWLVEANICCWNENLEVGEICDAEKLTSAEMAFLLGDHEFDQSENGHRHAEKFLKNFNQTDQDHLKKLLKTRTVTDRDSLFTYFAPDVVDNSVDVQIIGMLDRDTLIRNKNLDQDFFTPKRQQNLLKMPGINKLR